MSQANPFNSKSLLSFFQVKEKACKSEQSTLAFGPSGVPESEELPEEEWLPSFSARKVSSFANAFREAKHCPVPGPGPAQHPTDNAAKARQSLANASAPRAQIDTLAAELSSFPH